MAQAVFVELRRFSGVELQLPRIDLQQLATHPQSTQSQAVRVSRADNELAIARRIVDEPIHDLDRLCVLHEMQVIEEQNDAPLNCRQIGSERLDLWFGIARELSGEIGRDRASHLGVRPSQCRDQVAQESTLVVIVFVEGQPGARDLSVAEAGVPRRHESRLTVSGGRGYQKYGIALIERIAG